MATRPELPDTHLWLGKTLADDGKRDEAIIHLRDAWRDAAPNDPRPRRPSIRCSKKHRTVYNKCYTDSTPNVTRTVSCIYDAIS